MRVAVLAASPAYRLGLRALLESLPGVTILAASASPDTLREVASDADVWVAAASDGVRLEELGSLPSSTTLLWLSDDLENAQALAGLTGRAWALLSPDAGADELSTALSALLQGWVLLPPDALEVLQSAVDEPALGMGQPSSAANPDAADEVLSPLTEREVQVLQLLAQGLANKQIAAQLAISANTVKYHVTALYQKLNVNNRTEAVRRGVLLGVVVL